MTYTITEYAERNKIMDCLWNEQSVISNIIYNLIQYAAMYSSGVFFISLEELRTGNLRTTYFDKPGNPKEGFIKDTQVYWKVLDKTFVFGFLD